MSASASHKGAVVRLGRGLISPCPESDRGKVDEGEVIVSELVITGVSDAFDDDDLQFARAVVLAVRRGIEVLGRFVAGDRLLEARELDDDEAVEFLRAPKDLELAAARQELAAELLEDAWYQVGVLLSLIGIIDLRARDPIGDHLILHANYERPC